jgi:hypothetical protein
MTTSSKKIGQYQITGDPSADWSHAAAVLAGWYAKSLYQDASVDDPSEDDQAFRQRLLRATSIEELSGEDLALAKFLANQNDNDLSYWPGGENYRVSLTSATNPLGLPGDLWGAVGEAEDGALVSALVASSPSGELSIMLPGEEGWQPLIDLGIIEGDTMVGLLPDAVELFQKYDRDNTLGVIASYPLSEDGPFPSMDQLSVPMPTEIMPLRENDPRRASKAEEEPEVETEPEEEELDVEENDDTSVTASVTLDSVDDLTAAIAAAVEDPELRWYVERRVQALGLEASLPWRNS